jgi:hypothetical protein
MLMANRGRPADIQSIQEHSADLRDIQARLDPGR